MTPTQREEDLALLEEIVAYTSAQFQIDEELITPGSARARHIARLYEQGFIVPRYNRGFFNPRTTSIDGPSQFILTKSGQEYLAQLRQDRSPSGGVLRAFITHGKKHDYIQPAQEACRLAGFEPVVSIYEPNANRTIEQKVSSGMKRGDVIVALFTDDDGAGNPSLNAASEAMHAAFSGQHLILLKEQNVSIPTNLDGRACTPLTGQWTLRLIEELNKVRAR